MSFCQVTFELLSYFVWMPQTAAVMMCKFCGYAVLFLRYNETDGQPIDVQARPVMPSFCPGYRCKWVSACLAQVKAGHVRQCQVAPWSHMAGDAPYKSEMAAFFRRAKLCRPMHNFNPSIRTTATQASGIWKTLTFGVIFGLFQNYSDRSSFLVF